MDGCRRNMRRRSVSGCGGAGLPDSLRTSVPADRRFLPTSRRIDRGINDICYAYKGEMAIGFAASYGTLTSDDTDLMLILDGIDMKGSVFTLNPSFGYFIKDNICLGVRFGYTRTQGTLGNVSLNLSSCELKGPLQSIVLPKIEYKLMELLMLNKGIYLSTEDILVKVWGYESDAESGAVWVYISYVRKRLAAIGADIEIRAKRSVGYTLAKIGDAD